MGRGHRASSRVGSASFRNAVLAAGRRGLWSRGRRKVAAPSRVAVSKPRADARRVIIKAHVARMRFGGAKAAALHLRYIERDGVEKDGSKGQLYAADGPARVDAFGEPRRGEQHQFRLIVSPEDAAELDLTDYVRRLMSAVETDLGRKLEWAAVNHYDTAHPHAHVVIRGVDREGREVRLDRGYISQGLRWRAQELATQELGPRLSVDVRRAHAREVSENRFTSLDRELERRAREDRVEARTGARAARVDESTLVARLEHLEVLRLAVRCGPASWTLTPGWQGELRELGMRGDVLKQIHKAISCDPAHYRVVREGEPVPVGVHGVRPDTVARVAGKGLSDEVAGAFYAVLETPEGRAFHVPIDGKTADAVRIGDLVSFGSRPEPAVRPMDRHIAESARSAGGVCVVDADGEERLRGNMVRRLRELERAGLVSAQGPARWSVPGDLVERLERRASEAPQRERVWVQKLAPSLEAIPSHPGPVWLDKVEADALAPWGFGSDVRRAIERRREIRRGLGTSIDDPQGDAKRRESERQAVGEGMALRTGQQFLARTPDAFRGDLKTGPEGTPYVVVTDGSRFVLLPSSRELRALEGRTIEVSNDQQGRLRVRVPDRGLER